MGMTNAARSPDFSYSPPRIPFEVRARAVAKAREQIAARRRQAGFCTTCGLRAATKGVESCAECRKGAFGGL